MCNAEHSQNFINSAKKNCPIHRKTRSIKIEHKIFGDKSFFCSNSSLLKKSIFRQWYYIALTKNQSVFSSILDHFG